MKASTTTLFAVLCIVDGATTSASDLLWDNGLVPNGRQARAISPPGFPDIRVVDDFVVRDEAGWSIESLTVNILEDQDWLHGGLSEIYIWDNGANGPEQQRLSLETAHTRIDTGDQYFGRRDYLYILDSLDINLPIGTYWIGLRQPNGGGDGTDYWMSSDGGRDGVKSLTPYFSLDEGTDWLQERADIQRTFRIRGHLIPEPATGILCFAGLALIACRR